MLQLENRAGRYVCVKKLVNLQYNTLLCWDEQLTDQVSDVPSITIFFIISCKILCKNCFNLFILFFCSKNKEF